MSYIQQYVDNNNNMKCDISEDNKYRICSNYDKISNNIITSGINLNNIKRGDSYHNSAEFVYNNINFANNIDSNNAINLNNCINNDACNNITTFTKIQKTKNDIIPYFNNLNNPNKLNENITKINNICKEFNVCAYKSDNNFLLKKTCDGNICNYNIYCECQKD
jgi:hypothetical protein